MRSSINPTAVRQHMSEIVKVKNGRDVDYLFSLNKGNLQFAQK